MFFIMDENYKIISKHKDKDEIKRQFQNLKDTKYNSEMTKHKMYILIEGLELEFA